MLDVSSDLYEVKRFGKVVCESSWRWNDIRMTDYDLWYVWDGEGEVLLNGTAHKIGKNSCLLFRPGDRISASHNPEKPLVVTYIHFFVHRKPQQTPGSILVLKDPFEFESYLTHYVHLLHSGVYGCREEAALILKQLMIHLLRQEKREQVDGQVGNNHLYRTIYDAANYIRQNPGNAHDIEQLAARARLSPRYFSGKFKEVFGQTVESYIIASKINRAEHLLRFSGMNVTEVAEALGYRNVYFFSRQFKKYRGKNPSSVLKER